MEDLWGAHSLAVEQPNVKSSVSISKCSSFSVICSFQYSLCYTGNIYSILCPLDKRLLYMCDSRVPIIYHESKSIPWVQVHTMSPSPYIESKSVTWVRVYTVSPSPYHESKSIPSVHASMPYYNSKFILKGQVYSMSPRLYHESNSIPWHGMAIDPGQEEDGRPLWCPQPSCRAT